MIKSKTDENYIFETNEFRISFITERLFRIEKENYLDLPTQVIINRQVKSTFSIDYKEYKEFHEFETPFIKVLISKDGIVKKIGLKDSLKVIKEFKKDNLKGTARTLDGVNESCPLSDGVISKNGVAILDDSNSLVVYDNQLYPRKRCSDLYYFAYGNRYQEALNAFYMLTGNVPLIPKYALGNWWSRYHAYSDEEYIELIEKFKEKNIPISVSVIDMDWHYVNNYDEFKDTSVFTKKQLEDNEFMTMYYDGWTGYTWNKNLFKDYKKFLKYLHDNNLKVTLNLHPALGIRKYEESFELMANELNIDPKTTNHIPFDVTNKEFMNAYFKVLHHPYENDGVNFWWIDWQQGSNSKMEALDPLWALNHYHYIDNDRSNNRPLILSRYSGPGSHRYPLGFSGDTYITWQALKFQPYFTSTATNIGYVWWSHDIGGHMCGIRDNELYLRWLQLGVFSPINRLHSTSNLYTGKEPWKFEKQTEKIATYYLQLRKALIPYLYSMNYQTYKNNKAIVRPMYYDYLMDYSYKYKNQFMFGSELLVMPITTKTNKVTSLAQIEGFLPKGKWFDIFTNRIYEGNISISFYRDLYSIPVFAKEGSIIPMFIDRITNNISNNQDMEILVYSGNNTFELYEDDGESKQYLDGNYSIRLLKVSKNENEVVFTINKTNNPLYHENIDRNIIIKFKDILDASIESNDVYNKKIDGCLCIEFNDKNIDFSIKLTNIKYLSNKNKKAEIVDLVSSYQMNNDLKNDLFLYYYDSNVYKKSSISKNLRGPIEEILKSK